MQHVEQKFEPKVTILDLMDKHVRHWWSRGYIADCHLRHIAIHLDDEKPAQQILYALGKLADSSALYQEEAEMVVDNTCTREHKCYVLKLSQVGVEKIWGQGSFDYFLRLSDSYQHGNYSGVWSILQKVATEYPALYNMFLRKISDDKVNILVRVLQYMPLQDCLKLIDRISFTTVMQTLGASSNHWCAMMTAAWSQSEENFIALLKKASPWVIANAVCVLPLYEKRHEKEPDSTIEIACKYQSSLAVCVLLQKLSHPEAKTIINKFYRQHPRKILLSFVAFSLYQSVENCRNFLASLDTRLIASMIELLYLNIESYKVRSGLRALQHKLAQCERKDEIACVEVKPTDSTHEFTPEKLLAICLKPLQQYDKEKPTEEKKAYRISQREEKVLQQFRQGVFVKIVREEAGSHNKDFITHLFNPAQRQTLRNPEEPKYGGYKIIWNPDVSDAKEEKKKDDGRPARVAFPKRFPDIVLARTEKRQNKPPYTLSSKHPVTFVSKKLRTGLFGYHADREMVGYAFTVNTKNIKLLSAQDCGTYQRWWYNTDLNVLTSVANHALHFICKSFDEFVKRVERQPFVVNEALVKLHRNDLFAIVIARDTPKAREIALERRLELLGRYRIDLPILFYHPEHPEPTVYASAEQHHDYPRLWLTLLDVKIRQQFSRRTFREVFFGRSPKSDLIHIEIDGHEFELDMLAANQILAIITANAYTSARAFDEIMKTLQPSISGLSYRHQG